MNKAEIEEIKDVFNSIICLCVEGAELFSATKILNSICKEAEKGYDLVSRHLTPAAPDSEGLCLCSIYAIRENCNHYKNGNCILRCP